MILDLTEHLKNDQLNFLNSQIIIFNAKEITEEKIKFL